MHTIVFTGISPRQSGSRHGRRFLLLAVCLLALVIGAAGQSPVPIEKEPMHRLRIENEFVRVFDVLIPAGKESLAHTHFLDGVGVRVSNAEMSERSADGTVENFTAKWGEAGFGSGPAFSHTVINPGKTDFRNIYVELMPRKTSAPAGELLPLTDRDTVLISNERVRVVRRVLKPGESSKMHTHPRNGVGIVIYDAKVEISAPNTDTRVIEAKSGDVVWQTAGLVHLIKNVGTTDFVAVEIEIL